MKVCAYPDYQVEASEPILTMLLMSLLPVMNLVTFLDQDIPTLAYGMAIIQRLTVVPGI